MLSTTNRPSEATHDVRATHAGAAAPPASGTRPVHTVVWTDAEPPLSLRDRVALRLALTLVLWVERREARVRPSQGLPAGRPLRDGRDAALAARARSGPFGLG